MRRFVYTLCFILLCAGAARAQDATLSGSITDTSGAVVPQASVQLRNQATGIALETESNATGAYAFPFVQPGVYDMTVTKTGFETLKRKGITLSTEQTARGDLTLTVGSAAQTVEVNAGVAPVDTTDASVGTVVNHEFVANLPLNGRSFQSLLYMTPGVTLNAGGGATGSEGTTGQFVVNGQRADTNYWMIDGVSGNIGMSPSAPGTGAAGTVGATSATGGTSALVSVDAMQEFRIETSTYAPEFGRVMGGQISVQTRSGTNQFHGTLFEYLRNGVLDAKDWFADYYGLPKAAEIQNDFGGVVGGPIIRDKTFFFFSYEGLRVIQPLTQIYNVPDLAARAAAVPAMKPYMNMYPLPAAGAVDTTPGSGIVPYTAAFSDPSTGNIFSLRLDHQLTRNLNLFARYNYAPSSDSLQGSGGLAANDATSTDDVTKTATAGATWIVSNQVVNDARLNYSVNGGNVTSSASSFGGGTPMPAFPFAAPFSFASATVYMIPAFGGANMNEEVGPYAKNYQRQYNLVDTLSVQKGNHSLKFGVDYRRLTPSYGQVTYEIIPIFFSIADMEAGNCYLYLSHYGLGRFKLQNLGVYGQDTWRINSRLNLTYGLRWDVDYAPQTQVGIPLPGLTGFSLTSLSNLAQAPGTPAFSTKFNNFAPRIGGAYKIGTTPDRELVLRGGFGVFYGLASSETVNDYAIRYPLYPYGTDLIFSSGHFPFGPSDAEAVLPPIVPPDATNGQTLFGLDPNLNSPYALEWNVALEQSLGKAQTFSLSYIGASDRRQLAVESTTNPNPKYANAYLVGDTGTLSYQAMQAEFQRRLTKGLQMLVGYTWSHSIDTGSYGAYSNGSLADVNANRGNSDYDIRNVFSAAITYQLPAVKNNLLLRAITSDWSTDDVVQIRSGAPIDITDGNFTAFTQTSATLFRPDIVPGHQQYLTGSQYPGGKALNPAAFTDPPSAFVPSLNAQAPTRQGDLGRNSLRAPGLTQWDFSAHRDFTIHEGIKLQFRGELFNILNHPNFGPYNSSFQTGNVLFGKSTQMLNQFLGGAQATGQQSPLYLPGGTRSGEFALKLIF
jgi:hypothetical protein